MTELINDLKTTDPAYPGTVIIDDDHVLSLAYRSGDDRAGLSVTYRHFAESLLGYTILIHGPAAVSIDDAAAFAQRLIAEIDAPERDDGRDWLDTLDGIQGEVIASVQIYAMTFAEWAEDSDPDEMVEKGLAGIIRDTRAEDVYLLNMPEDDEALAEWVTEAQEAQRDEAEPHEQTPESIESARRRKPKGPRP